MVTGSFFVSIDSNRLKTGYWQQFLMIGEIPYSKGFQGSWFTHKIIILWGVVGNKMTTSTKEDTAVDRIRSKSKEDRTFALKLNNHFCPMTNICITGQKLLSTFRAKVSASK